MAGTVILSGNNTFTGGVTVSSSGGTNRVGTLELATPGANAISSGNVTLGNSATLLFGADNQLASSVNITSGGGAAIKVGSTTQTAGSLTLTGNSSIVFGSGGSISFATSTASGWAGTLYVSNYVSSDVLRFGTTSSGLGSGGPIFSQIVFVDPGGTAWNLKGQIDASGFVRPVPEVGSLVYGGLLTGLVGWGQRRNLKNGLKRLCGGVITK